MHTFVEEMDNKFAIGYYVAEGWCTLFFVPDIWQAINAVSVLNGAERSNSNAFHIVGK